VLRRDGELPSNAAQLPSMQPSDAASRNITERRSEGFAWRDHFGCLVGRTVLGSATFTETKSIIDFHTQTRNLSAFRQPSHGTFNSVALERLAIRY
jgi:hypothetical protein